MKVIGFVVVCVLALHQLTFGQNAPVRPEDGSRSVAEVLTKLDRELDDAYERGDVDTFQRLLAEDMINISSTGSISRKANLLEDVARQKLAKKISIAAADIQVYLFGETAIITSIKTAKMVYTNTSTTQKYLEANTYVRKDGRWQLISQQDYEPPYTAKDVNLSIKIDEAQIGGNKKAAIVLIEFADYQCEHCRQFAAETMKQIERDYITNGRIGYVFYDLPMENSHPYAIKAAVAVQCAGKQGRLWEMNHKLLSDPMALTPNDLMSHAASLMLDMNRFRRCVEDVSTEASVRQKMREAFQMDIKGTPIFLVGIRKTSGTIKALRMIEGGYPYEVFKATLEALIATRD